MEIPPLSGGQATVSQSDNKTLTADFESFLTLLTTQLQHQDPLEPVNATEFTAQLAQFAAVEQGIKTNSNLEKLINFTTANQALSAVAYLGKSVEAKGDLAMLSSGKAEFAYALPEQATATALAIENEAGVTVRVLPGETTAGKHSFTWDGTDAQGLQLPDGKYRLVVNAVNAQNAQIKADTFTVGIVDGADNSGDTIKLSINGITVPLSDVVTVREPPPSG